MLSWGVSKGPCAPERVCDPCRPLVQAHDASPVRCMRYSHHGRLLLSCDDKGRVKIWKDPLDMLHVTTVHREPCR